MGCSFSSPFDGDTFRERITALKKPDHPQKGFAKSPRGWNWDSAASANNQENGYAPSK